MTFIAIVISLLYSIILYRKTNPDILLSKKILLIILRSISLFIVISFLIFPVIKLSKTRYNKPRALLLIDNSESMNNLVYNKRKSDIIKSFTDKINDELGKNFKVKKVSFNSSIHGSRKNTDLLNSLEDLYIKGDIKDSEIFLFSDGYYMNNDFYNLKEYSNKINTFIFSNEQKKELPQFVNIKSNKETFISEKSPLEVTYKVANFSNCYIEVSDRNKILYEGRGIKANKDILSILTSLKFDRVGLYNITISLKNKSKLFDQRNIVLKVNDNKSKIVFITDQPSWSLRSIKDEIVKDNKYEFTYLVNKNDKIYLGNKEIQLAKELNKCNLLIIENNGEIDFSDDDLVLLKKCIKNKTNVIEIGDIINDLEDYYPITHSQIKRIYEGNLVPGYNSEFYSIFSSFLEDYKDFPPLKYKYYQLKKSAQEIAVIDNSERSSAISYMDVNETKILHLAVKDFWRLGMREDTSKNEYSKFIGNIVTWISSKSGENFIVDTDKNGYNYGENIHFKASLLDEKGDFISFKKLKLKVYKTEIDSTREILSDYLLWKQDSYEFVTNKLPIGHFTYKIIDEKVHKERKGEFVILNNNLEQNHQGFNNIALREISYITDGFTCSSDSLDKITKLIKREPQINVELSEIKILYNLIFFFVLIACYALELFLRRRFGLV